MNIGGGKVRSERMLLAKVENGKNMMSADSVRFLVLHCSASRCNQDYSVEQLRRDHKARGFYDIGYHFYIRKDGTMTQHRKLLMVGAHARPYNRCSIGICYEGGLDEQGKPCQESEDSLSESEDCGSSGLARDYSKGVSVPGCWKLGCPTPP